MKNMKSSLFKYAVASMMIGALCPSLNMVQSDKKINLQFSVFQKSNARETIISQPVNANRYYGGYKHLRVRPTYGHSTTIVVGATRAASVMPSSCVTVVKNGKVYRQCADAYYQPVYQGNTLMYKNIIIP